MVRLLNLMLLLEKRAMKLPMFQVLMVNQSRVLHMLLIVAAQVDTVDTVDAVLEVAAVVVELAVALDASHEVLVVREKKAIKNILKRLGMEKRKMTNLVHLEKILLVDVSAADSVVVVVAIVHGISTAHAVTPTAKKQLEISLRQMESLTKMEKNIGLEELVEHRAMV